MIFRKVDIEKEEKQIKTVKKDEKYRGGGGRQEQEGFGCQTLQFSIKIKFLLILGEIQVYNGGQKVMR